MKVIINKKIVGKLYLPKEEKPLCVLCHGFLSRASHLYPFGHALRKNGFGVFSFDFSGHGKSKTSPENIKVDDHYKELVLVIRYLRKKYGIKRIFLLGYSMGGLVSLKYASNFKTEKLILVNPVIDFIDCMKNLTNSNLNRWHKKGYEFFKPVFNLKSKKVNKLYLESGEKFALHHKIKCPVLFLQGDRDKITKITVAKKFYKKLSPKKKFVELDSGHILLSLRVISRINSEIAEFLN